MSDWTPTSIGEKAATVADYAKQIDSMLWHVQQYKVADNKRGEFTDDMLDRINRLDKAIREFKELDTDKMLLDLQQDLVPFKLGVL